MSSFRKGYLHSNANFDRSQDKFTKESLSAYSLGTSEEAAGCGSLAAAPICPCEEEKHQRMNLRPAPQVMYQRQAMAMLFLMDLYYEQQSRLLQLYEKDRKLYESKEQDENDDREDSLLMHCCLALTILSLIGNLIASILSGSLSILSTFVDSSMDLLCSAVMNVCLRLVGKADTFNYPRGRQRLEYVGILICAILMAFANVTMAMQAFNNVADESSKPEMTFVTTTIVAVQTVLKGLLSWICYRRGSPSSIVVAMDLRNDVVTRISAVVFAYIGDEYWRLADPIGAILLCSLIALSWFRHALEYIPHLVGKRAEQEQLSRILKIAIDHDPRIRCLDHVMVYHTGEKAFVELHVVMDEKLTLKVTHDVCHPLEKKLQRLEFVERAFVHCDYCCDGD
ncbi:cation diffusion facilitator family transporter [Ancylostoma duodenale]|uniref:Cation diffusion facilitator family transporter n=1 Tax=Ancylostoma duodenale TaxID=51022 RepID=A0A0C2GUB6_9BILA|nr:cation diffusion facilitator family transporter [Ancylostoma duodenale]